MPLFLSMFIWRRVLISLPGSPKSCQNPDSSSLSAVSKTPAFLCPLLKTCSCSRPPCPGVPGSHAVPLSVCTCPPCAPPAPLFLLPTAQFLTCASRPSADLSPRYFLPCFYQAAHTAFALSVVPRGCSVVCFAHRHPALEVLGGISEGALAFPSGSSYYLPSLSSCTSTIKSRKAAENHLLYPKLCKSKEPEPLQQFVGRAAHPTGTPRPHGPPHVAPVAPLLPAGTGRGRRVRGTNPPSECVRACVYVCARSGCLAANGAWEAQTGGWFSLDDFRRLSKAIKVKKLWGKRWLRGDYFCSPGAGKTPEASGELHSPEDCRNWLKLNKTVSTV